MFGSKLDARHNCSPVFCPPHGLYHVGREALLGWKAFWGQWCWEDSRAGTAPNSVREKKTLLEDV